MADASADNGGGLGPAELQTLALRGVTWSSASSVIGLPFAIVVSVVLARALGPEGFARFAYLAFVVPLLMSLSDLGFAQALTRSVSQAFAGGDLERTRHLLGAALGWNLLRLPLLCAIVLITARPGQWETMLVVGSLTVSGLGAGLIFSLQAENRGATIAKVALVQTVVVGSVTMATALAGGEATTVWAASFASSAVVMPAWLLATNPRLRRAALAPRLPRGLTATFWRFGILSLASTIGATLVFSRSEVVLLEVLDKQHALAVFALAYGLSQRLTTPVDTLLGPLTTALSALGGAHPQRLRAGFDRALRLSAFACAFLAATALVGTAFLAPLMYGDAFSGVGLAFAALAAVSILQSIAQPYTALAYAIGRPAILLRALAFGLIAGVGTALALIPPFGLWGAVTGNAVGGLTAIALTIKGAAGPDSLRLAKVPVLRLASITAMSCGAAYGAGLLGGALHGVVGAAAAFAGGTVTFLILTTASGRLLQKADIDALLGILPRRMRFIYRGAVLATRAHP